MMSRSCQHRYVVMEELDNYDFFISLEDDMKITPAMVEAYRRHSRLLQGMESPPTGGGGSDGSDVAQSQPMRFLPGFLRYEENLQWDNRSHCIWGKSLVTSKVGCMLIGYTHTHTERALETSYY